MQLFSRQKPFSAFFLVFADVLLIVDPFFLSLPVLVYFISGLDLVGSSWDCIVSAGRET
jgi:ABC-type tungstate transport system substrate-binding protein